MARDRNHDNNKSKNGRGRETPVNSDHIHDFEARDTYVPAKPVKPLEPKNAIQSIYMNAINTKDLIFGTGPAGTGKTYVAVAMACAALKEKQINKIILTRPAVEAAGEQLGFLPGELDEKYAPYIEPVRQIMTERLGAGFLSYALKNKQIEPLPLAFMRGRTFDDAWIILDEAQNTTPEQMKMLLTRVGRNCKVLICGDLDQSDIHGTSGLFDAIKKTAWMKQCSVVEFEIGDCVRSPFAMGVLQSYSKGGPPVAETQDGGAIPDFGIFEPEITIVNTPWWKRSALFQNLK